MRAPAITAENLANQVDVVSEEIRLNVLNRPYGGFPWIHLPPVLFDSFANAHNGYGDFVDLQAATVADCADVLRHLLHAGQRGADGLRGLRRRRTPRDLIEQAFRRRARTGRRRSGRRSPSPGRPRSCEASHPTRTPRRRRSPSAGGCPTRSPTSSGYLAFLVLAGMLTDGESSRLQSASGADEPLATDIWASAGPARSAWTRATRTVFGARRHPSAGRDRRPVIDALDEEIAKLADDAAGRARSCQGDRPVRLRAVLGTTTRRQPRTRSLGSLELLHGRRRAAQRAARPLSRGHRRAVAAAAQALDPTRCAVLGSCRDSGGAQCSVTSHRSRRGDRPHATRAAAGAAARDLTAHGAELSRVDTVLDNGLRVFAVRKPRSPLVEVRLRVPFARDAPRCTAHGPSCWPRRCSPAPGRGTAAASTPTSPWSAAIWTPLVDPQRLMITGSVPWPTGLPRCWTCSPTA